MQITERIALLTFEKFLAKTKTRHFWQIAGFQKWFARKLVIIILYSITLSSGPVRGGDGKSCSFLVRYVCSIPPHGQRERK
jgi:hypothetical protein